MRTLFELVKDNFQKYSLFEQMFIIFKILF